MLPSRQGSSEISKLYPCVQKDLFSYRVSKETGLILLLSCLTLGPNCQVHETGLLWAKRELCSILCRLCDTQRHVNTQRKISEVTSVPKASQIFSFRWQVFLFVAVSAVGSTGYWIQQNWPMGKGTRQHQATQAVHQVYPAGSLHAHTSIACALLMLEQVSLNLLLLADLYPLFSTRSLDPSLFSGAPFKELLPQSVTVACLSSWLQGKCLESAGSWVISFL